jgi:hypothetical protein
VPEELRRGDVISRLTPDEVKKCKQLTALKDVYFNTINGIIREHAKIEVELREFWHGVAKKYLVNEDEKMFIDFETGELKRG